MRRATLVISVINVLSVPSSEVPRPKSMNHELYDKVECAYVQIVDRKSGNTRHRRERNYQLVP